MTRMAEPHAKTVKAGRPADARRDCIRADSWNETDARRQVWRVPQSCVGVDAFSGGRRHTLRSLGFTVHLAFHLRRLLAPDRDLSARNATEGSY